MGTTTISCAYFNPVDAAGALPASSTPFAFASSSCELLISTSTATGTPALVYTYTAGDVLIGFMLLCLILISFLGLMLRSVLP